ncbi:M56 family metallopeptidase [Maribacter sp. 2210JD10-5]|uniref:M56 family metallopeptidase n=1 Tax=Maribacter sp. 2210JD10-5 TaxID=3386272 RepID=UPI0039BD34C7
MFVYILKSTACMAIFFIFYKLLLEKENMHVFKRFYLLLAIGTSLLIPALVFTEFVMVEPTASQQSMVSDYDYIGVPPTLENDVLDVEPTLWAFYVFGFIFFGLRFIKNLGQIIGRIRSNPKQKSTSFIRVLLRENFPPHTFFNYIFLNRQKLALNEIPKEVMLHEETHAKQMHSCDVICIELLQVFFWFNPLIQLFKKAIKLNHEFLADQSVLNKNIDKTTYQNTLLSYISLDSQNKYQSKMANAINYSSIKKRFTVMKTHTSKKAVLLRSLLLLPLLAILLLGFSETKLVAVNSPDNREIQKTATLAEIAKYNELAKKYNTVAIEERNIPLAEVEVLETIYRKMNVYQKEDAQPFPECLPKTDQDGASRKQMAEYNALAKKYNEMDKNHMRILIDEVDRLEYIYGLMSDKQKADAEPFPHFPEPPKPPMPPSAPNEKEEALNTIQKIIEEQDPYDVVGGPIKLNNSVTYVSTPPTPPEPKSPLDFAIQLAKKDATFYYEGKKITSDEAIALLKKNKSINMDVRNSKGKRPIVKLSKQPIPVK